VLAKLVPPLFGWPVSDRSGFFLRIAYSAPLIKMITSMRIKVHNFIFSALIQAVPLISVISEASIHLAPVQIRANKEFSGSGSLESHGFIFWVKQYYKI
jgi:hypothetical protein